MRRFETKSGPATGALDPGASELRALLVDDNDLTIKMLRDFLTNMGFDAYVAETVKEATYYCDLLRPNFVVANLEMDSGIGFQAIMEIREITARTRIIATTSGGHADLWPMASFLCGADIYVAGPVTQALLESAFARVAPDAAMH